MTCSGLDEVDVISEGRYYYPCISGGRRETTFSSIHIIPYSYVCHNFVSHPCIFNYGGLFPLLSRWTYHEVSCHPPDSVHRLFFYCSNVTSKYIVHDYAHTSVCRPQSSAADLRTSSCQTCENSSKVLPWPIARASMGTMLC